MKKVFLLFALLTVLLAGCSEKNINNKNTIGKENSTNQKIIVENESSLNKENTTKNESSIDINGIEYEEGIYPYEDLINHELGITETCINKKETAIKIASCILEEFQEKGYFGGYTPQSVFFDTKDKIWIVSFWESRDIYTDGADFSIAIKAENAQVIKMWVGE